MALTNEYVRCLKTQGYKAETAADKAQIIELHGLLVWMVKTRNDKLAKNNQQYNLPDTSGIEVDDVLGETEIVDMTEDMTDDILAVTSSFPFGIDEVDLDDFVTIDFIDPANCSDEELVIIEEYKETVQAIGDNTRLQIKNLHDIEIINAIEKANPDLQFNEHLTLEENILKDISAKVVK